MVSGSCGIKSVTTVVEPVATHVQSAAASVQTDAACVEATIAQIKINSSSAGAEREWGWRTRTATLWWETIEKLVASLNCSHERGFTTERTRNKFAHSVVPCSLVTGFDINPPQQQEHVLDGQLIFRT